MKNESKWEEAVKKREKVIQEVCGFEGGKGMKGQGCENKTRSDCFNNFNLPQIN